MTKQEDAAFEMIWDGLVSEAQVRPSSFPKGFVLGVSPVPVKQIWFKKSEPSLIETYWLSTATSSAATTQILTKFKLNTGRMPPSIPPPFLVK